MYKGRNLFLKRILALAMAGSLVLTFGCGKNESKQSGAGTDDRAQQSAESTDDGTGAPTKKSDEDAGASNSADNTDASDESDSSAGEASAEDASASDSESDSASSTEQLESIDYTYKNFPMELSRDYTGIASGNYYTITLEKNVKDKYPKLQEALDNTSDALKADVSSFFSDNIADINDVFENGWGVGFESDHDMYPVRSDSKVVSFLMSDYTYMAGAHGVTGFTGYNFDPVTGESIQFEDVVKKTDGLPEIIVDELIKQNDDLKDYFGELSTDKENLLSGISDRYKNNARMLAWVIDYDGIVLNFEDYAMGSYAIGTQSVKLKFADYPEFFTDTYNNYEGVEIPVIAEIARELKEEDKEIIDASTIAPTEKKVLKREEDILFEESGGEDWWYHATVHNPGWSAWCAEGIDTDPGTPSFELKELSSYTTDWIDEDKWAAEKGIRLPNTLPYTDDTYNYSAINNAEGGELSLTVYNHVDQTLCGIFYFDEFITPPDQGTGLFADFTEPGIDYAEVKDGILYVALGHRTYAAANPHKSYIVAIDTTTGETLWRSEDQVCGSHNFVFEGDSIICGYGFTDEPDYIYILNKKNGKTQKQIKVKSAPYYFVPQEDQLYVITYNTEYLYSIKK